MYEDRQNFTLAVRHPELWKRISSSIQNQFVNDDGLYTTLVVTPFPVISDYNRDRSWILINRISFDEMGVSRGFLLTNQFHLLLLIALFCALISGILGKTIIHKNLYREALKKSALYDNLTGLPNRKLLEERARQVLDQSRRYSRKSALIFIDLDGFKAVNDSLGHDAGDELLKQVGERMVHSVRAVDTVARFGGDEFIILLSQIEHDEDCALVGQKILDTLSNEFSLTLGSVSIGASLGIVVSRPDGVDNLEGLIQRADAAMYDVKSAGKNDFKIV
jgi:diguanylate cyclase (GGDEF)-like protein